MIILAWAIRSEADLEDKIKSILERFSGQKFNDITIAGVRRQYDVDGRKADIALLKDDNKPLLIIETKKKYKGMKGWKIERRFIPTSEEVVGQAVSYVALLKRSGVYVPFVATANDRQLALFMVPENVEEIVDWDAISRRDYGNVIKDFYNFKNNNLILHKPHGPYSEEFFKELLEIITGIYANKYSVREKRQEWHWLVLEDLRSFIEFLTPFIEEAIAQGGRFKENIASKLEEYEKRTGYILTPQQLAREMAYILMNKIIFYKVLERYYNLPRLDPLYEKGIVKTCSEYLRELREYFIKAIEVTRDFQAVFETGIYDEVDVIENEEVLRAIDWIIRYIERYEIERLGDVVGFIYEELIPAEERHQLGQFYTPKPIAELITKWCIRSPDDKVLDPGCGSGTFLVEAYKRLAELKLKKPWSEVKHVPGDLHGQILRQLYGVDINEFPAHLTAINLAMKNVRAPTTDLNIVTYDFFSILPEWKRLPIYPVVTPSGSKYKEIVFPGCFDVVMGNPPYTRWTEIPRDVQENIEVSLGDFLTKYNLRADVKRGREPGLYVYFIMHAHKFLKPGGRLGMIISDSWLQTAYGVDFGRYLLENFKVKALIDISARVFPVPLIGTCIILLEMPAPGESIENNKIVFMYLSIPKGETFKVEDILWAINNPEKAKERYWIKVYRQGDIPKDKRWLDLLFRPDEILEVLKQSSLIKMLSEYFEPSYGNILYLYLTSIGKIRGVRNVGGEEFFYLTEERARGLGIPQEFLHPLLPSSRYLQFFTFTQGDWENLRKEGAECYLFLCHKSRNELPERVRNYIRLGEGSNAQIRLRRRPGEAVGKPVSESSASQTRREHGDVFFDWYDLGGVVKAPIYVARGSQYWVRFVLAKYQCALDDRILALIPQQGVDFNEVELKALLAYLTSSFAQLQAEVMGRSTGGGMIELDVKPLSNFVILDVKRLTRESLEELARLFDELEAEARRLGGADAVENVFGSELAKDLTGRENIKEGVSGLFNTVIKEIDEKIGEILQMEALVEPVRAMVVELARRRLSRATEAKPGALRGSEELSFRRGKHKKRRSENDSADTGTMRLTDFM